MLKFTQTSKDIAELSINYTRNFLVIAFCLLLVFIVIIIFSYEHISLKADTSKNKLEISHFSFFSGIKTQNFRLSSVKKISLGGRSTKSRSQKYNYEKPFLILNNEENVVLLKKERQIGFKSDFADEFNNFLQQNSSSTFQTKTIYIGIISSIILGILGTVIPILLVIAVFIGNVIYIFNKNDNCYMVEYSSPLRQNTNGNLSDIKNILLLKTVKNPTFAKQAGLHIELSNQKLLMIQAYGELSSENTSKKSIQIRQKAKELANFLAVNLKEEEH